MNIKPLKKLKLKALDNLNQKQRIELVKHEFSNILKKRFNLYLSSIDEDEKANKFQDDLSEYFEIENYLINKGYYDDVYYARYSVTMDRLQDFEFKALEYLKMDLFHLIFTDLVVIVSDYFVLDHLLSMYYKHFCFNVWLPIKDNTDDEIYEDNFTFINERLISSLDFYIGLHYETFIKHLKLFKENGYDDIIFDENVDIDDGVLKFMRENYTMVTQDLEKLKEDGFSLSKENEVEIRIEIAKECNERNNYKPNDIGYMDTENLEPFYNDVIYDLENSELILPKDFNKDSNVNLMKYVSFDDEDDS